MSRCCSQIWTNSNLREEEFIWLTVPVDTVYPVWEDMVVGAGGGWLFFTLNLRAERWISGTKPSFSFLFTPGPQLLEGATNI